jgi:sulfur carrier protein
MRVIYRDQQWEFNETMTVRQLVERVGLLPGTVLALRNGKLITEDQVVRPDDEIKLIAIVSGG